MNVRHRPGRRLGALLFALFLLWLLSRGLRQTLFATLPPLLLLLGYALARPGRLGGRYLVAVALSALWNLALSAFMGEGWVRMELAYLLPMLTLFALAEGLIFWLIVWALLPAERGGPHSLLPPGGREEEEELEGLRPPDLSLEGGRE